LLAKINNDITEAKDYFKRKSSISKI
jgi:hypothetical protein